MAKKWTSTYETKVGLCLKVSAGKAGGFNLLAAQSGWKRVVGIGIGIEIGSRHRFLASECPIAIALPTPIPIPTAEFEAKDKGT